MEQYLQLNTSKLRYRRQGRFENRCFEEKQKLPTYLLHDE